MLVLITYDVNTESHAGKKRLRSIAKECQNYGQRVQNSVFECSVDAAQYRLLKARLCDIADENDDSIRFYNLGNNSKTRIETYGHRIDSYDAEEGFLSI